MSGSTTNCTLTPHHQPNPQKCPSCAASDRYLAPPDLNTSASYVNAAERRAATNPWHLEEGHYWVLGSVKLLEAIQVTENRAMFRRSQGAEYREEESMCLAKCRYHIKRLADESDAELANLRGTVEGLLRDPRMQYDPPPPPVGNSFPAPGETAQSRGWRKDEGN